MQSTQESSGSRSAKWPLRQRLAGRVRRLLTQPNPLPPASGLIVPELFSPNVAAHLPEIFATVRGPRVAIFYDGIPLKFPELTPPGTVARFPSYLRELLLFDGVAAISEDSAASLRDYWKWLGIINPPPVQALPLGVAPLEASENLATANSPAAPPRLLCVCTVEGRKNHLALLEACEVLWREELRFELQLIGMARPDTAGAALTRISELQRAGRPLIYSGAVPAAELDAAYRRCNFTVYPSLIEGFGMPVIESVQHGKPCICSGRGALGESAHDGGCVPLESVDSVSLANAIRHLLQNPAELARLATAARQRKFRSWRVYAEDFQTWMTSLGRVGS